jgi:hypothetical protein
LRLSETYTSKNRSRSLRIIWNEQENWFQAELTPGESWRDDLDSVKLAGFKTTGEPSWQWYTSKISALNKLRSRPPKSGLVITELALEKFKLLSEQLHKKQELKKTYEKLKKAAQSVNWPEFLDPDTGVMCYVVSESKEKYKLDYTPPKPPDLCCVFCGQPLYCFDATDVCVWCG